VEHPQELRVRAVRATDEAQTARSQPRAVRGVVERAPEPFERPLAWLFDEVRAGLSSEHRKGQIAHGVPSSDGER